MFPGSIIDDRDTVVNVTSRRCQQPSIADSAFSVGPVSDAVGQRGTGRQSRPMPYGPALVKITSGRAQRRQRRLSNTTRRAHANQAGNLSVRQGNKVSFSIHGTPIATTAIVSQRRLTRTIDRRLFFRPERPACAFRVCLQRSVSGSLGQKDLVVNGIKNRNGLTPKDWRRNTPPS